MNRVIINKYEEWKSNVKDTTLSKELAQIKNHEELIEDAFYKELDFGTGGLRGVIGVGTNRINIYTVAKASQGLSDYIIENYEQSKRRVAIAYDSRINSRLFAETAASVFAANGIKVYIYKELMPTPCLSFAVREMACCAGIVITASHNPAKYNGYKVYGGDGCQITNNAAKAILDKINKIEIFSDVKKCHFNSALNQKTIEYIPEQIFDAYIESVLKASCILSEKINRNFAIVYSPLNGTGMNPVKRALYKAGYKNITVVKEQEKPDGNFSTCTSPNPEEKEALSMGIEYAKQNNAKLVLATDPDCDRVGAAVRSKEGEYVFISGNEMGILLFDYVCSLRIKNNTFPENPVAYKTIVTTGLGEKIADFYGVKLVNVLTGFKYIGEQIGYLESKDELDSFVFGFEESYGYLSGTYVRDKDGVNAALLICEMYSYYMSKGISLLDKLKDIYNRFGFCINVQRSFVFEGSSGFEQMEIIMNKFRNQKEKIGNQKILKSFDYSIGLNGLPKSNVLKFVLEGNCTLIIRPSGTEPKLKVYTSASGISEKDAAGITSDIFDSIKKTLQYDNLC